MIITQNLNKVILYAQEEAERLHSEEVESRHLLLAILRLEDCSASKLLAQTSFDAANAKGQLDEQASGKRAETEPLPRSMTVERLLRIAEAISREYTLPGSSEWRCPAPGPARRPP